jgi:hypothetical protein
VGAGSTAAIRTSRFSANRHDKIAKIWQESYQRFLGEKMEASNAAVV